MSFLIPSIYFRYLAKHYFINFIALLLGLSVAFAMIDYFQQAQKIDFSFNYTVIYIYLVWQEALGQLYPIAIVFAGIMTKLAMVKSNNMVVLHAFGYTKRKLFLPFFAVSVGIYLFFMALQMTQFSYAKDDAQSMVEEGMRASELKDLFFIYDGDYVYAKTLDPIKKIMKKITIFRLDGKDLLYTAHAKEATYDGVSWKANDITIKRLVYDDTGLKHYDTFHQDTLQTLKGYKPKMIESIQEGKSLNIIDMAKTYKLLDEQKLKTTKLRSNFYTKAIFPLFSLSLLLILFFKIPFHIRYMNFALVLSLALGVTFLLWGFLFALNQMGHNGVLPPEVAVPVPVAFTLVYALYIYFLDRETI